MATDMERFVSFEEAYYDQYDYYNLLEYSCHAGGKGRTKREIELNTNRHCPAGHERKIAEKFHNSQMKRRRTKSSSSWCLQVTMFVQNCCKLLFVCMTYNPYLVSVKQLTPIGMNGGGLCKQSLEHRMLENVRWFPLPASIRSLWSVVKDFFCGVLFHIVFVSVKSNHARCAL